MIMGIRKFNEEQNKLYCKLFGIDKFRVKHMIEEEPSIIRVETKYVKLLFFFEFVTEERKLFYRWRFTWKDREDEWCVILDPIVKKTLKNKDILYDLDENAMKEELNKFIQNKKKGVKKWIT